MIPRKCRPFGAATGSRQPAEGEVRRVPAYVVPDPGHIPDPPSKEPERIPTLVSTVAYSILLVALFLLGRAWLQERRKGS